MQGLLGLDFIQALQDFCQAIVAAGARPAALDAKSIRLADDMNVR